MSTQSVADLYQENAELRAELVKLQEDLDNRDDEIRDLQLSLEDAECEISGKDTEIDELSQLYSLASDVAGKAFKAEVVECKAQRFGTRITMDVNMTVGEAIYLTVGKQLTLLDAHPEALTRLSQAVQRM